MNEFFEKLIERLEEQRGHICNCMPCDGCKYIGDCNEGEFAEDVALDRSIEIVKSLAAEYNDGWISCSERLPEKSGKYLVTQEVYNINSYNRKLLATEVDYVEFNTTDNKWYRANFYNVVAWQPLPKPYREKGEKE